MRLEAPVAVDARAARHLAGELAGRCRDRRRRSGRRPGRRPPRTRPRRRSRRASGRPPRSARGRRGRRRRRAPRRARRGRRPRRTPRPRAARHASSARSTARGSPSAANAGRVGGLDGVRRGRGGRRSRSATHRVERRAHPLGLLAQRAAPRVAALLLGRPAGGLVVARRDRRPRSRARRARRAVRPPARRRVDPRAPQPRPVQGREVARLLGIERLQRDDREAGAVEQRVELARDRRAMRHAERDDAGEPRDDVERVRIGRVQRVEHERAVADLASDRGCDRIGIVADDLVTQRVRERQERHPRRAIAGRRPHTVGRPRAAAAARRSALLPTPAAPAIATGRLSPSRVVARVSSSSRPTR